MERSHIITLAQDTQTQILQPNSTRLGFKVENLTSSDVAVMIGGLVPTADQAEVDTIAFAPTPGDGTFALEHNGNKTVDLAYNANAAAIQAALRNLPGLGAATVSGSPTTAVVATLTGGPTPGPALRVIRNEMKTAGVAEVQTIQASQEPTRGGEFMLVITVDGGRNQFHEILLPVPANISAGDLQTALRARLGQPALTVSGTDLTSGFTVTFGKVGARYLMKVEDNKLKAWQSLLLITDSEPASGAFKLAYEGVLTDDIAYNADAMTVEAELQELPGLEDVEVSGTDVETGLTVLMVGVEHPSEILVEDNTMETAGMDAVDLLVTEDSEKGIVPVVIGRTTRGEDQKPSVATVTRTSPGTAVASADVVAAAAILDKSEAGTLGVYALAEEAGDLRVTEVF